MVLFVLGLTRREDVMFSIDLKESCFHIPIYPTRFSTLPSDSLQEGPTIQGFCFGLSTAPQVFTRVFFLVLEWTHKRGLYLLRYLDDWLVVAESVPHLLLHHNLLLQLCKDLGIVIIIEKSDLKPTSKAQYFRMLINTI